MKTNPFERFGGLCAFIAGLGGLAYSISFVIISQSAPDVSNVLSPLFLLIGGLLGSAVMLALYQRLRETEASFALWAALLGVVAALGSALHGGYDLANAINPPALSASFHTDLNTLPSQVDPRGLLTFGVTGLAFLIVAWLIVRGGQFPRPLGYLGYALAVLLLIVYLGRLILLQPSNPVLLGAAALTGFLLAPVWYIWLGLVLWRSQRAQKA
ncbi:MAG TPA: hypothetical protein VH590_12150 [Ktedonobacterales bacterium]|jgi:hypothetical protein